MVTNVVLQSFDWGFLSTVHGLEPALELCALGSGTFTAAKLTSITNAGARRVAWDKGGVTADMLNLIHQAGLTLFVWTVDGPEIKTFIDLGVDGIISNDPAMVRQLQEPTTNGPVNLREGLLTYWRMDDGLSNALAVSVADSKGTNTATLARGDALSHWFGVDTAVFGGCLQLDGTNASVTVPQLNQPGHRHQRTDDLAVGEAARLAFAARHQLRSHFRFHQRLLRVVPG